MASHPIVHIELAADDLEKLGKFYANVFNWKVEAQPDFNYTTFDPGVAPGGGFNPIGDGNPRGNIILYIDTDDIEETLRQIEANGGKALSQKTEIPGIGWWATFEDPAGNRLAVYKSLGGGQ